MEPSFEFGYGSRGYAIAINGQVDEEDTKYLAGFLNGLAWRPSRSPEDQCTVAFLVPAGSDRAWMGTAWDAGADSFGRLGTVGAKGHLLKRSGALDRITRVGLAEEIQQAMGLGRAVVVTESDRIVVPREAVLLQAPLSL